MSVHVDGTTKLTYEEYRLFPDDGRRHEVIDGVHYVSPAPTNPHQAASRHIQFALYSQIELEGRGIVVNAPIDLELDDTNIVQPDLVVVLNDRRSIVTPSRMRGVPNLVVEILSPATAAVDRSLKRALYEGAGVPEYWIVDVEDRRLDRYVLGEETYAEPEIHRDSIEFAGARVDLTDVWRRL